MTNLIVDSNSLYARCYHVADKAGSGPSAAVGLMVNSILLLLDPNTDKIGKVFDNTFFAWDGFQNPLKDREEKPKIYHDTKEVAQEVLSFVIGAKHCENKQFEADDIVATAVAQSGPDDVNYIVSSDKDLQQLKSKKTHYYCLNIKSELTSPFICTKWHVKRPSQVALALAIIGDTADNIKGVPGWGPAKCRRLFESVTSDMTFAEALEQIEKQIPDEKLTHFKASLKRTLLNRNVPGVPSPAPLRFVDPDEVYDLDIPEITRSYTNCYNAYAFRD